MTWEDCQNFGYVEVDHQSNGIRVYSDRIYSRFITCPGFGRIESAIWSGRHVICKVRNSHGVLETYLQKSFHEYLLVFS